MIEQLKQLLLHAEARRFALYAICGGSGVLVDLGLYTTLVLAGVGYQLANAAGYAMGTLLSFVLNRHYTFRVYDSPLRRMALFFGIAGTGYLISTALLWVLIEHLHLNPLTAKLVTLGVVLVVQFSGNRAITFRRT
jgi:putative flippase GtrA